MNLLITTLGTSWQIIPELLSVTNPLQYDFFCGSEESVQLREKYKIQPVDEVWVITTTGTRDIDKLKKWVEHWNFKIRLFICNGVENFSSQNEILLMRSFIYRTVLNGKEKSEKLYLSLSGGRKTMSADMQEAGNLFGCDLMIHVVDKDFYKNPELSKRIREDDFLSEPNKDYQRFFVPLVVNIKTEPSLVVSADRKRLVARDYPLNSEDSSEKFCSIIFDENGTLEEEIQRRKESSNQLYANFYGMISERSHNGGDIFRKLYFLHPDILRRLKKYKLGKNYEQDFKLISKFPKAELHSHLGGVLSPEEIIKVAECAPHIEEIGEAQKKFNAKISKILSFKSALELNKEIYKEFTDENNFYAIGIDKYQKLGDFQGSTILQTKETISKTLEIYAENLIRDNVRYVEIRFSPYKYTKLGLSVSEVISIVSKTLDKYKRLEYRLIYIIGREATKDKIKKSIEEIVNLFNQNPLVAEKIAGIDLAGNEGAIKPSELRELFMPLLERCMRITIHAGETEGAESIWEAVYHLSAERIGHGLRLLDKKELLQHFADKNIGVEMCPSSNDQIVGFSKIPDTYPLKKYLEAGLKVTLNTDDCGISRTYLSNEFIKASKMCNNLTLWDVIVMIRNSLSIAFCDKITKSRLMHEFEDEILKICQEEFGI